MYHHDHSNEVMFLVPYHKGRLYPIQMLFFPLFSQISFINLVGIWANIWNMEFLWSESRLITLARCTGITRNFSLILSKLMVPRRRPISRSFYGESINVLWIIPLATKRDEGKRTRKERNGWGRKCQKEGSRPFPRIGLCTREYSLYFPVLLCPHPRSTVSKSLFLYLPSCLVWALNTTAAHFERLQCSVCASTDRKGVFSFTTSFFFVYCGENVKDWSYGVVGKTSSNC